MSQRRREEEKRRREEEETKAVYNEFVSAFAEEPASSGKAFVRGGVVQAGKGPQTGPPKSSLYKPEPLYKAASSGNPSPAFDHAEARAKAAAKAREIMEEAQRNRQGPDQEQQPRQRQQLFPPTTNPSSSSSRPPKSSGKSAKPKSNLETFKDELQKMQRDREERKFMRKQLQEKYGTDSSTIDRIAPKLQSPFVSGGTYDQDDPYTTNLFLSNLATHLGEPDIIKVFGRFGPLASVKVMYPRNEEERSRGFLCGFVAFMTRVDSERAVLGLEGRGDLLQSPAMRLSWAKGVNINHNAPLYVPPEMKALTLPPPRSNLPFNAQPQEADVEEYRAQWRMPEQGDPDPLHSPDPAQRMAWQKMIRNAVVRVVVPTERAVLTMMHRTIEFVVREGPLFEAALMAREASNAAFRFLFDNQTPAHVYYRWKLYSILQGDDVNSWRTEEFRLFVDGSIWRPPPQNLLNGGMPKELYHLAEFKQPSGEDGGEDLGGGFVPRRRSRSSSSTSSTSSSASSSPPPDETEKKAKTAAAVAARLTASAPLSDSEREELEDLLRGLVPERRAIGEAMLWCIRHSESAFEIVECIAEALAIPETPLHKKLARLYLVSDILANCSQAKAAHVAYFRRYFESRLVNIFAGIQATYARIAARLKAEGFKQRVMAVFRCWEEHSLYVTDFLIRLQNIFLGLMLVEEEEEEKEKEDAIKAEEDIDGVPLPLPTSKLPATLVDYDVDGAPLEADEDSEEETGETGATAAKPLQSLPAPTKSGGGGGFKASKWEEIDPSEVVAGAMTTSALSKWEGVGEGLGEKETSSPSPENLDGAPMADPSGGALAHLSGYGQGSEDGEEGADEDVDGVPMDDGPSQSLPAAASASAALSGGLAMDAASEARRRQLREVELKVVEKTDELEATGKLSESELRSALDDYRRSLLQSLEAEWAGEAKASNGGRRRQGSSTATSSSHHQRKKRSRSRERRSGKESRKRSRSPSKHSRSSSSKHSRRSTSPSLKHKKHRR